MIRQIVTIDQDKCDGCGLCVPACHEGAIQIIGGKARLTADNLCDGLGACLGHCPQDAISIEKREAQDFDERAVTAHLKTSGNGPWAREPRGWSSARAPVASGGSAEEGSGHSQASCCPSQRFARLGIAPAFEAPSQPAPDSPCSPACESAQASQLAQWPVQLRLLPARAPVFRDARLLLAADCVPFALPDFHTRLLAGHALAIACPKLDDCSTYVPKLTEMIAANDPRSITVVHMEVPCCTGILRMALEARAASGVDVPVEDVVIGVRGDILDRRPIG